MPPNITALLASLASREKLALMQCADECLATLRTLIDGHPMVTVHLPGHVRQTLFLALAATYKVATEEAKSAATVAACVAEMTPAERAEFHDVGGEG